MHPALAASPTRLILAEATFDYDANADCRGRWHRCRYKWQRLLHWHDELPLQRMPGCSSTDFPILNAYQPCLDQAPPTTDRYSSVVHVLHFEHNPYGLGRLRRQAQSQRQPQGEQLIWSTYLGGSGTDSGTGIALDPGAANVYVVGTTNSTDIGTERSDAEHIARYQPCLDTPVNPAAGDDVSAACRDLLPPTLLWRA